MEDETAAATDDVAEVPVEVPSADAAAEHAAPDTDSGAAEEAVAGDVVMTEPKTESQEVADGSGVDTAKNAADGDGNEAAASKR